MTAGQSCYGSCRSDRTDRTIPVIVVEHQERLTRLGFNDLDKLLARPGRPIAVIKLAENSQEELMEDLVSLVTSFGARLYGQRRGQGQSERSVAELQNGEESDHSV